MNCSDVYGEDWGDVNDAKDVIAYDGLSLSASGEVLRWGRRTGLAPVPSVERRFPYWLLRMLPKWLRRKIELAGFVIYRMHQL